MTTDAKHKENSKEEPKAKPKQREEIIQLSGVTILTVLVIIANFLTVGFIYRYHSKVLYREYKEHDAEYALLLKQEHDLHVEIEQLEHVASWNDTAYEKAQRLPK